MTTLSDWVASIDIIKMIRFIPKSNAVAIIAIRVGFLSLVQYKVTLSRIVVSIVLDDNIHDQIVVILIVLPYYRNYLYSTLNLPHMIHT
jgi:hypothetical protein